MPTKYWIVAGIMSLMGWASFPAQAATLLGTWNETALEAIRVDQASTPKAARALAMTYLSVFDAVNGIEAGMHPQTPYRSYLAGTLAKPHRREIAPTHPVSVEAAAASAAHQALINVFPQQKSRFDTVLATQLATIADNSAKTDGITWGRTIANQIVELRTMDGSSAADPYIPSGQPGRYGGTWGSQQYRTMTPFAMAAPNQFRAPVPIAFDSTAYTSAFEEVKRLGSANSGERTAEQSEIAQFWQSSRGTATTAGDWLKIGGIYADQEKLSLPQTARLFALLGIGMADAAISSWDSKATYDRWRPQEAIRQADQDGNPNTIADPTWRSFSSNFGDSPEYTSGHSTLSATGAAILAGFHGGDHYDLSVSFDTLPGVTRSFSQFSQMAEEGGRSRIYGGVHFESTNQASLQAGYELGGYIMATQLQPEAEAVPEPTTIGAIVFSGWGWFRLKRRRS